MIDLTITGAVATFNYVDDKMNNALSSYAKHRFETTADYITNGAWRKLFQKASEKLEGKTIDVDPNLEFIDEILNNTKLQTNDDLIELWSSLLSSALLGKDFVRHEYFDVISKLNPYDVRLLDVVFDDDYNAKLHAFCNVKGLNQTASKVIIEFINYNYQFGDDVEIALSIRTLKSLFVIEQNSGLQKFSLTILGKGLKRALSA